MPPPVVAVSVPPTVKFALAELLFRIVDLLYLLLLHS